ncbi:conserved hypothetical protein [Rhodopseudomonas palustris BisB5]|uniref:Uncharacterized protein n=2 Tax=Rhodopseudomonas TaxID=1073 RepID=Q132T2_RHOPS|nr:conserved hypothetical protein [Rhodopseudomonas palustris BisB5]
MAIRPSAGCGTDTMAHTLEQKIIGLLEQETALRQWLEQMRALIKDARGATLIAGLTAEETEEFLRLDPRVRSHRGGMTDAELEAASERHSELKHKIDAALQDNVIESLSDWGGVAARG